MLQGTALIVSGATLTVVFGSHSSPCFTLEALVARYRALAVWIYFLGCIVLGGFYYFVLRKAAAILLQHIRETSQLFLQQLAKLSSRRPLDEDDHAMLSMYTTDAAGKSFDAVKEIVADAFPQTDRTSDYRPLSTADEEFSAVPPNEEAQQRGSSTHSLAGPPSAAAGVFASNGDLASLAEMDEDTEDSSHAGNKRSKKSQVDVNQLTAAMGDPPTVYRRYIRLHPLSFAGLAGVMGAQNTLFAKTVAEILSTTFQGNMQLDKPLAYVFIVALVLSIVFQQHFLAKGECTTWIQMYNTTAALCCLFSAASLSCRVL